jgi:hypothetical protein
MIGSSSLLMAEACFLRPLPDQPLCLVLLTFFARALAQAARGPLPQACGVLRPVP